MVYGRQGLRWPGRTYLVRDEDDTSSRTRILYCYIITGNAMAIAGVKSMPRRVHYKYEDTMQTQLRDDNFTPTTGRR